MRYERKLRLTEPEAWLPASAWEDREFRPYVPSRYAVCLPEFELSRAVSSLPEAAQRWLRNRELQRVKFMPWSCATATTKEARELSEILDDAGLEQPFDLWLAYDLGLPSDRRGPTLIVFEPYLPHGEFTCSACG